jgi:hypothetical protein
MLIGSGVMMMMMVEYTANRTQFTRTVVRQPLFTRAPKLSKYQRALPIEGVCSAACRRGAHRTGCSALACSCACHGKQA